MAVVKLCGIKSEEDAALMNEVKPDYVGFVFAPGKHQISAASACRLSNIIRYSRLVGVFVNEQPAVIAKIAKQTGLDVIQLHGDESDADIRHLKKAAIVKYGRLCVSVKSRIWMLQHFRMRIVCLWTAMYRACAEEAESESLWIYYRSWTCPDSSLPVESAGIT